MPLSARDRIDDHIRANYVQRRGELGLSWSDLADRFEQTDRTSSGRALAAWARQEASDAGEVGGRRAPRGRTPAAPDEPRGPRGRSRRPRVTTQGAAPDAQGAHDGPTTSDAGDGTAEALAAAEGVS